LALATAGAAVAFFLSSQAVFSVYCGQSPIHFDVTNVEDPNYQMPLSTFTDFVHSCGGFNGTSIARFVKVLFLPNKVADIKKVVALASLITYRLF